MTVKLIRMWSGEDVITDVVEETNDYYKIENPIVAVPSPQENRIAFAPWSLVPFLLLFLFWLNTSTK